MKILASDFDNTIYFLDNEEQNKKNRDAIDQFIREGNVFCIITGRNYTSLKKHLTENKIPYSYLICEDGAKLFNNMDYCIDTTLLEEETIKEIIPILENNHYDYYLDDGYNKTEYYKDCVKIVVDCVDEERKNDLVQLLKETGKVHIYASRYHVNIIHKSVNKENALKKLFNLEKLNYNLLHVIGDNENDYEMIKAFNGVIMKNHHKLLDDLGKTEYETLEDYIKELMQN